MAPPKERKRKFHRRSKQGCLTCKTRHVRCDERKPLCTYCLQSGRECVYPVVSERAHSSETDLAERSHCSESNASTRSSPCSDFVLNDYVGGEFESLAPSSKELIKHFTKFSIKGQQPVARTDDCTILHGVRESPGYLHIAVMLSACQWAWVTGSMESVRWAFLYHKTAMYQLAREQVEQQGASPDPSLLLAISALALAEVGSSILQ
jgi:hypothetical protein